MEITLIRHGKPTFELTGKARSSDISTIIENYNLSGVCGEPPELAKLQASTCKVAVCSDFARSLESARALGCEDIYLSDPLFREVATPHFRRGSFSMPLSAWGFVLRSLSVFGFSLNGESLSMAQKRAHAAATALIDIANIYQNVLLVGHGFINYFIAKELLSRKWIGPSKPGNDYWGFGVYRYDATYADNA